MMRSHGWTRDLSAHIQKEYRSKYNISSFNNLYNFYLPCMKLRSTDIQAYIGLRAIDKLYISVKLGILTLIFILI